MKVRIVGAGFSGLTLAYFLVKRNVEVEIFEASNRSGGLISTRTTPHGLVESAANGVYNSALFEEMLKDLNVPLAPRKSEIKKRYIFRGSPKRWPLSIIESIVFACRFSFLWLIFQLKPKSSETIQQWGTRVGGEAFAKYLLAPALQGIYAGDVERMSAALILNRFFQPKSRKATPVNSGTVSPEKGMGQMIEALSNWLRVNGVKMFYSQPVLNLDESPWVIATSGWQAAELLQNKAPSAAANLRKLESLPIVTVTLFFQSAPKLRGFGCLFPKDQNFTALGVLFNTDVFTGRGLGRSETWILGGAMNPQILQQSDEEILKYTLKDRAQLMAHFEKPLQSTITRWPKALPHYTLEWKEALKNISLPPNIHLTGNYLGRIGLSQILDYNFELAKKLAKDK